MTGKRVYIAKEPFAEMWNKGVTVEKIAKHFHCSTNTASRFAATIGLPSRKHAFSHIDTDKLRRLWHDRDYKIKDIEKILGRSEKAIRERAKKLGLGHRFQQPAKVQREEPPPVTCPLLLTEGRYSRLSEYAQRYGVTLTEAQRRYHKARAEAA